MSKPKPMLRNNVIITLHQKRGPMATYWNAAVKRGKRGPILFDNMDASREIALAGAENWCRRLGFTYKIKEA